MNPNTYSSNDRNNPIMRKEVEGEREGQIQNTLENDEYCQEVSNDGRDYDKVADKIRRMEVVEQYVMKEDEDDDAQAQEVTGSSHSSISPSKSHTATRNTVLSPSTSAPASSLPSTTTITADASSQQQNRAQSVSVVGAFREGLGGYSYHLSSSSIKTSLTSYNDVECCNSRRRRRSSSSSSSDHHVKKEEEKVEFDDVEHESEERRSIPTEDTAQLPEALLLTNAHLSPDDEESHLYTSEQFQIKVTEKVNEQLSQVLSEAIEVSTVTDPYGSGASLSELLKQKSKQTRREKRRKRIIRYCVGILIFALISLVTIFSVTFFLRNKKNTLSGNHLPPSTTTTATLSPIQQPPLTAPPTTVEYYRLETLLNFLQKEANINTLTQQKNVIAANWLANIDTYRYHNNHDMLTIIQNYYNTTTTITTDHATLQLEKQVTHLLERYLMVLFYLSTTTDHYNDFYNDYVEFYSHNNVEDNHDDSNAMSSTNKIGNWNNLYNFLSSVSVCEWNNMNNNNDYSTYNSSSTSNNSNVKSSTSQNNDNKFDSTIRGGIFCNEEGFVTQIALGKNNLQGTIMTEIGRFQYLESLRLDHNSFSYATHRNTNNAAAAAKSSTRNIQLPTEIGKLSLLKELIVNDNNFIGTIPTELVSLQYLSKLYLHGNSFDYHYNNYDSSSPTTSSSNDKHNKNYNDRNINNDGYFDKVGYCRRSQLIHDFRTDCIVIVPSSLNNNNTRSATANGTTTTCSCCTYCCSSIITDDKSNIDIYDKTSSNNSSSSITSNAYDIDDSKCTKTRFKEFYDLLQPISSTISSSTTEPSSSLNRPTTISVLDNATTSQFAAMNWLANYDTFLTDNDLTDLSSTTLFERIKERYVLAIFYFAMGGINWFRTLHYLNASDVCTWHDGYYDHCGQNNRVTNINLEENNMVGTLPPEIGVLSATLEKINFAKNDLHGSLPSELGALTELSSLDLRINDLDGSLPTELGQLTELREIVLSNNEFIGPLPWELQWLRRVTIVQLDNNELSGTFPSEIGGGMTNLEVLFLNSNKITGAIPTEFGKFRDIEEVDLSFNLLNHTLPSELGLLSKLITLSLGSNEFEGALPSEIGYLTFLRTLKLESNNLTGTISTQLGSMTNLEALHLTSNRLSGPLPSEIGVLTALRYLHVDRNRLNGKVPTEIGNLSHLKELKIYRNYFNGTIPTEIGSFTSLTDFDFDSNEFTGSVPTEVGLMRDVERFFLLYNHLTGTLPSEMGLLTNMETLIFRHNQISGAFPTEFGLLSNLVTLSFRHTNISGDVESVLCRADHEWDGVYGDCVDEFECSCCRDCCTNDLCCDRNGNNCYSNEWIPLH